MTMDHNPDAPTNPRGRRLCVDFDGVIHDDDQRPFGIAPYGPPREGAVYAIRRLIARGYEIVILTARTDFEEVKGWLAVNGFPELEVTNVKPPAIAYIDDRAIRFTDWQDIRKRFS